jgi:hypothetical protein
MEQGTLRRDEEEMGEGEEGGQVEAVEFSILTGATLFSEGCAWRSSSTRAIADFRRPQESSMLDPGLEDWVSAEDSGSWSDSDSSMASGILEQEAHTFGLPRCESVDGAIGPPQQMQIAGPIIILQPTISIIGRRCVSLKPKCSPGVFRLMIRGGLVGWPDGYEIGSGN